MEHAGLHQKLKMAISQRNILVLLGSVLLFANVVLAICLFSQKQRTIVVPANLRQEMEFKGNDISVSYLEEMSTFFSSLLLDLTPKNITHKSKLVLKHVEPSAYHTLQTYFEREQKKHQEYNLATYFHLTEIVTNPELLYVDIYGVLTSQFGTEGAKEQNVSYRIKYKNVAGKLLILDFRQKLKTQKGG